MGRDRGARRIAIRRTGAIVSYRRVRCSTRASARDPTDPCGSGASNRWATRVDVGDDRRRVEGVDVLEEPEDRPHRHPRAIGHLPGRRAELARLHQVEERLDDEPAGALGPQDAAVGQRGAGRRRSATHEPDPRKSA